ncbi:MAG TPA: DNA methyltransferase [Phycisphaerales bacterium]|nr:DNA methyltransferase [Phycisphaerales bacterium]HBR20141.1 DNA methyltransferase [Phycisphaerales bacterium]
MSSFFPWMGGKSRVAPKLAKLLPKHDCYVEVFAGAANLLFAKEKRGAEVINDINSDLINLFRIVRWHYRAFLEELRFVTHSRKDFTDYRLQSGLTDIQRAARTWYILKTAFGGKGGTSSPCFGYGTQGMSRFRRTVLSSIHRCHKRLDGVVIENLDFEDIIKRYDRKYTLFFCDPPYWQTAQYIAGFDWSAQKRLHDALAKISGKFLLTINNHNDVRKLYKTFCIRETNTTYSICKSEKQQVTELVIANFELPKKLW